MDKSKLLKIVKSSIECYICACNKELIISTDSLDGDTVSIYKKFEHNDVSLKIGYEKTLILTSSICDGTRCIMTYLTRYTDHIRTLYIDVDGERVTINFEG